MLKIMDCIVKAKYKKDITSYATQNKVNQDAAV